MSVEVMNVWTDKAEVEIESVHVQVTRKIEVGKVLKINPSEAYLGIDSGNVRVLAIVPAKPDNLESYGEGIDTEVIIRHIEEFKDIHLDSLRGEDYASELARLDDQPWVVYQYVYNPTNTEWAVLPLEEFVEHTMMY